MKLKHKKLIDEADVDIFSDNSRNPMFYCHGMCAFMFYRTSLKKGFISTIYTRYDIQVDFIKETGYIKTYGKMCWGPVKMINANNEKVTVELPSRANFKFRFEE